MFTLFWNPIMDLTPLPGLPHCDTASCMAHGAPSTGRQCQEPCAFAKACCCPSALAARGVIRMTSSGRRIARRSTLYHAGDRFQCLYVIRSGWFKTVSTDENGQETVMDFLMPGQVLGAEAFGQEHHSSSAVALEDSEVCGIVMNRPSSAYPRELLTLLCTIMSAQILRDQHVKHLLARSGAEERIARFLLDMSARKTSLGRAPVEFRLSMSRKDIGDYAGLALETVSRAFTLLATLGLIRAVRQKVAILDPAGLERLALGEPSDPSPSPDVLTKTSSTVGDRRAGATGCVPRARPLPARPAPTLRSNSLPAPRSG